MAGNWGWALAGSQGRRDGLSPRVQGLSPDHNPVREFGSESFLRLTVA